ncbi:hypothetical protein GCM10010495_42820 [Kitasatospora herbaricolor]|uniref:hypothetical protein n=1 Tax=Kitasatospora herbaricolor TaxID=68217 RepID=UPI00174BF142|nr:hypothetical protein [Kitasatospora herbaricolor]MDQ0311390.1 hypothetical protein [Kitasatospora herbaricolor]GGV22652.1 hypothetical protein GCM10010495_42820 [Kitasatospora herbaricolor]
MGPLTAVGTTAWSPGRAVLAGLAGGLLLGLAAASVPALLRDGRRRVHLRRARQLLSEPARGQRVPGWP